MHMRFIQRLVPVALIGLSCLATAAQAADKVKIAIIGGTGDIPFYLADAKGWFAQEGLEVEMITFDSGARMIAPMASGDIDVGTGAVAAGLYNAFEREITIRVVADKGRNVKGMSFQGLMVRKALVEAGTIRKVADLKGRKMAFTGPGANDSAVIDEAARKVGFTFNDIESVYLGLGAQLAAYQNGAIDASIMPEPFRTNVMKTGAAVELMAVADLRDNDQTGVVMYSDSLIRKRPEVAAKLMKLYIRAARYYNDSLKDGKIAGANADEVIDVMAKYSSLKDKEALRAIVPSAIDPDGRPSLESLRADLEFYKAQGLVKSAITVDQAVDMSWVERAVKELGPYKAK